MDTAAHHISNLIGNFQQMPRFFTDPADMEPLLPEDSGGALAALGWEIVRRSERLGAALHEATGAIYVSTYNSNEQIGMTGISETVSSVTVYSRGATVLPGAPSPPQIGDLKVLTEIKCKIAGVLTVDTYEGTLACMLRVSQYRRMWEFDIVNQEGGGAVAEWTNMVVTPSSEITIAEVQGPVLQVLSFYQFEQ